MKEGQEAIYVHHRRYAWRPTTSIEIFRQRRHGGLLLTDRVDEWVLSHLHEFDGKPLQSVAAAGRSRQAADEEEKKQAEAASEAFKPVPGQAEGSAEGPRQGRA